MAINPIDIYEIPGMNGLLRDKVGNLYFNQKWTDGQISGAKEFIKDIALISLHSLNDTHYIASITFIDYRCHVQFYGDISGIKDNPWRVNSAGVMKMPKTEKAFIELYKLILDRVDVKSSPELEKSFYKFIGSIGL